MADDIRHARAISPYFIPNKGGSPDDFHGLTDAGGDPTVGSEDIFIIGQKTKCATDKDTPEVTVPLTQLERGEMDTYLTLANLNAEPAGGLTLTDFSSALVDAVYYVREQESGAINSSIWFPKTAISTLNLNIDDPEARITRSFDLTTDDRRILTGTNNKFFIHLEDTAPSGTSGNYIISVSDPAPSEDPNTSGSFILRIDRTRSGTTITLEETTDFTYSDVTKDITILSALTDDVYNIYYSSTSFGTPSDPTTADTDTICFLKAENVTVLIDDGTTEVELDRLTALSLSATLNRIDENVIGNDERVLREISDTPVDLTLTARIKDYKEEKAFMNQIGQDDTISSVKLFNDNVKITIKIYDDATKTTFLMGYQVSNLSFTDGSLSITANEFSSLDVSAQTDDVLITATEGNL